ncbi:hypothetical protein Tco_1138637, partial [Tanacetum coccineum]
DKYAADILKKFGFLSIRTATTPIESNTPLVKDEDGVDVDVQVYRSMIGSLMYLTASRPNIMFAVYVCARFQVTLKAPHLNTVKRIFRYLKHQPKLGLWYPRDSPFELKSFSDSDYGGASLDKKSTIGGCQFLGRRLISWQCKKQTIVANSTIEVEYVAFANCCRQVLWIQNQMMDYGFNFMNTKIHIDNESTISVIKNPVAHSRTKNIEIRFHFIRYCYEKRLIEVIKIHIDSNVADLLTKGFDVTRFNFLVTDPSPRPSPSIAIPDSNPEGSGGNHGGQSSNDISLSGNEDGSGQEAKEMSQTTSHTSQILDEECCTEDKIGKKDFSEEKGDDAMDYMESEDAQDEGRTSFVVLEEKESADKEVSTEAPVSTVKPNEGTDKRNEGTDKQDGGKNATQTAPTTTSTPTPTIFGDDETIAQVLITMSQNKQKEKEKGVEIRNVEDTERPRPTSTRSILTLRPLPKINPNDKGKKRIEEEDESDTESEGITEAKKKFKQLANDEEVARKVQEEWEAEEEKKRLDEEEATKAALSYEY